MIMISRSSSNINCIVRRNNNIIRSLSQAVNSSKSSSSSGGGGGGGSDNNKSAVVNKVVVIDSKTQLDYSTVGRYYQTLVHKGGKGALGLRDLKHLFEKCLEPDHLKYAIKGVEMYQRKGHDFSEEINSLFIRLCIAAKNPKAAIDICSVYKYRLGAWSTPTSLGNLIESMNETMKVKGTVEDLIGLVNLITVSHAKGVPISKDNIKSVLEHTIKQANLEMHTKLIETAKATISNDDVNDLLTSYPAPAPAAPANEEKTEEKVEESKQ